MLRVRNETPEILESGINLLAEHTQGRQNMGTKHTQLLWIKDEYISNYSNGIITLENEQNKILPSIITVSYL